MFWHNGKWWVRPSAQIWNEVTYCKCQTCVVRSALLITSYISDFESIANASKDSCEKLDQNYKRRVKGKL